MEGLPVSRPQSEVVCGDGSGHRSGGASRTTGSGARFFDCYPRPELLQQPQRVGLDVLIGSSADSLKEESSLRSGVFAGAQVDQEID
jgi:hypothetical protein